ncbi:Glycerol-3-phosphate cytidylyltransferase [Candidatus Nitrosocosmicus oleophilus]|uniref:Glycerol-3-phosphate cytidylyltransferase n=2 Tax=Candidatus Nitrosocosmicus oleophilus TaxID=1353260 RepID=A0A654LY25_9ARCH|nr:Glycerol-3-phosphate cytidylyltransferase [Candidatus Nitrosocosmicus oleophilus]
MKVHGKSNLMNSIQRFLLCSIYSNNLIDSRIPSPILPYLMKKLELEVTFYNNQLASLEDLGLIVIKQNEQDSGTGSANTTCTLTNLGREQIKVVLVGGVFDLLHVGHIHTLKSAKSLGDVLIIVVATDSTVSNLKKNRKIYHDEKSRLELVSSIKFVDKAVIGRKKSIYDTVEFVRPDIIALGYDQTHDEIAMKKNCLDRGLNLDVVRLSSPIPELKSSLIKSELGNSFYDL